MDENKIKVVTLDEMKKIDPSLINCMTFTDGSVVMVNSDEDESENLELNNDLFNKEEKEPDFQNDPNMYINFEKEEEENIIKKEDNYINKNKNKSANYLQNDNNNERKKYNVRKNENDNLNRNQNRNYKQRNQKILISNNKNTTQQRNVFVSKVQNNISYDHSKPINSNNYNNISICNSKYSSTSSNPNQKRSYQYNKSIRNIEYKPLKTDHSHFMRRYYSNNKGYDNYNNNCIYCKLEKENNKY